jgi:hypothetical protein
MNCYAHPATAAVGVCSLCSKGICRPCVSRGEPRLVCAACAARGAIIGYEYRSSLSIAGWPLIHVASGFDPVTLRPRVARGVIAIGNVAVGGVAIGGASFGVLSLGGFSVGLLGALGGAALGLGLSIGGFAVGSVAVGGAAIGFQYALGGLAIAPAAVGGLRCDPAAAEFFSRWLSVLPLPLRCG